MAPANPSNRHGDDVCDTQGLSQHITELPEAVLELIMVCGTTTRERRALILTCKLFRQVLDNSLTCVYLAARGEEDYVRMYQMLKRLQSVHAIKAVTISSPGFVCTLPKAWPTRITSLKILGSKITGTEALGKLPCLKSLNLEYTCGHMINLGHVSGLTRLHFNRPCGSLAHLGPSLQHLMVHHYDDVQDWGQLTNLTTLGLRYSMPADFFQRHGNLPLQHMYMLPAYHQYYSQDPKAWEAVPATLTRLGLCSAEELLPNVLPKQVTHLQLLTATGRDEQKALKVLPSVKSLDLYLNHFCYKRSSYVELKTLEELSNLRSMTVCMADEDGLF